MSLGHCLLGQGSDAGKTCGYLLCMYVHHTWSSDCGMNLPMSAGVGSSLSTSRCPIIKPENPIMMLNRQVRDAAKHCEVTNKNECRQVAPKTLFFSFIHNILIHSGYAKMNANERFRIASNHSQSFRARLRLLKSLGFSSAQTKLTSSNTLLHYDLTVVRCIPNSKLTTSKHASINHTKII